MTSNTPFPEFKTTGDEKHDLETYIEDLIDYCVVQNWYDISKESEAAKWTNHDSRLRKKSNHDPRGKKLPGHASRKKYRVPSCQSRRQIASKLNLFYQTPDIPVFEPNQSSINLVNLQI